MNDINFKTIKCQIGFQMIAENLPEVLKHRGNLYTRTKDSYSKAVSASNTALLLHGRFYKSLTQEEKDEFNLGVFGSVEEIFDMLSVECTPEDLDTIRVSIRHYLDQKDLKI